MESRTRFTVYGRKSERNAYVPVAHFGTLALAVNKARFGGYADAYIVERLQAYPFTHLRTYSRTGTLNQEGR